MEGDYAQHASVRIFALLKDVYIINMHLLSQVLELPGGRETKADDVLGLPIVEELEFMLDGIKTCVLFLKFYFLFNF
jgi:hypothetical protein